LLRVKESPMPLMQGKTQSSRTISGSFPWLSNWIQNQPLQDIPTPIICYTSLEIKLSIESNTSSEKCSNGKEDSNSSPEQKISGISPKLQDPEEDELKERKMHQKHHQTAPILYVQSIAIPLTRLSRVSFGNVS